MKCNFKSGNIHFFLMKNYLLSVVWPVTPSLGQERSVRCGWPLLPVHNKPLVSVPGGSWWSFASWSCWGEKTFYRCVRGPNAIEWRAVLFLECKAAAEPTWALVGRLSSLLFPHVPLPHHLDEWCAEASREHRGLQNLGRVCLTSELPTVLTQMGVWALDIYEYPPHPRQKTL